MTHRFRTCFSLLTLGLLSLGIAPVRADTYNAGVAEFTATHPDGSRNLNGHVWYPTHHEGAEDIVQDSKVWRTISGHRDAPVASGAHPVVLMSHGMYGNALNQAWLAQELARAGVVSVLPNHPGTTTFDRDPEAARHLWLRATDQWRLPAMVLIWMYRVWRLRAIRWVVTPSWPPQERATIRWRSRIIAPSCQCDPIVRPSPCGRWVPTQESIRCCKATGPIRA